MRNVRPRSPLATGCDLTFATHEVRIRGRRLRAVYVAVSQGQAVQIGLGDSDSANVKVGDVVLGPLVTGLQIDPLEESARANGYLTKESSAEELVPAIRKILLGGRYLGHGQSDLEHRRL